MSSLLENRAFLSKTGRSVHFRDFSWRKNRKWKIYRGFSRGDLGQRKDLLLKIPVRGELTEEDCDREIEKYRKIKQLAEKFNALGGVSKSAITVLVPQKAVVDRTAGVHNMKARKRSLSRDEWILAIDKISDKVTSFVSRTGRNESSDQTLEAFVHFTYHESGGTLVVSKLRGVIRHSRYVLSYPTVHQCQDSVSMVMEKHSCNHLCRELNTPLTTPLNITTEPSMVQPSAPFEEDSDDDVFLPGDFSKHQLRFELQLDDTNHYSAVPYQEPCDPRWVQAPGGWSEPPPYCSRCPEGHRSVSRGSAHLWCDMDSLLRVGDSAPVQQAFINREGLS